MQTAVANIIDTPDNDYDDDDDDNVDVVSTKLPLRLTQRVGTWPCRSRSLTYDKLSNLVVNTLAPVHWTTGSAEPLNTECKNHSKNVAIQASLAEGCGTVFGERSTLGTNYIKS